MYGTATGWLGWSDTEAMTAPVPRILLAFDHRIKMEKARHGVRSDDPPPESKSGQWPPSPEKRARVAQDLRRAFGSLALNNGRRKRQ